MTDIPKEVSKGMLPQWIVVKNRYESNDVNLPPTTSPTATNFTCATLVVFVCACVPFQFLDIG
jgi:hypothetical protein